VSDIIGIRDLWSLVASEKDVKSHYVTEGRNNGMGDKYRGKGRE
jgi:hypothetical protein